MRYGVITHVPSTGEDGGNLALAFPMVEVEPMDQSNGWKGKYELASRLMPALALSFRAPVFALGEILVLDDAGREVAGHGRKPNKWDVGCEEFDTIEAATARAIAVSEA